GVNSGELATGRIPNKNLPIESRRNQPPAVGAESQRAQHAWVTFELHDARFAGLENSYPTVSACTKYPSIRQPVGRDGASGKAFHLGPLIEVPEPNCSCCVVDQNLPAVR